jgi:hypothetical protein
MMRPETFLNCETFCKREEFRKDTHAKTPANLTAETADF